MLFLLFNVILFFASLALIYNGFINFNLFLTLPLGLEILIIIGIVTPITNLYDTINNFIILKTLISKTEDE